MTDATLPGNRFAAGEFRIGRVLSRTMSVYLRNLLPFSLVTFIAALPNALIFTPSPGQAAASGSFGWLFFGWVVGMVLSALSQAIVLYGAFEDMRGRPVNLMESVRVGWSRILPALGVA